jgi:hypothetical protein
LCVGGPWEGALLTRCTPQESTCGTQGGRLVMLLPSDFFEGSPTRTRLFKLLPLRIEAEYKLGHVGYDSDCPRALTSRN